MKGSIRTTQGPVHRRVANHGNLLRRKQEHMKKGLETTILGVGTIHG